MSYTDLRALILALIIGTHVCNGSPVRAIAVSSHNLTGDSMLELGTSLNNSLVTMFGHAMVNLEEYINTNVVTFANLDSRLCEFPCTSWSTWTKCTATRFGMFGGQTRTRTCWEGNSLPFANDGEQVVDNESRVCEGICPRDYNISSNGLCLMAISSTQGYTDSEKICNQKGGHLINTDTKARWDDLVEIGTRLNLNTIWIDGIRSAQAGPWTYASGVEPTSNGLQHWYTNEPSNRSAELCKLTEMFSGTYAWCDRSCTEKYYALCEIRA